MGRTWRKRKLRQCHSKVDLFRESTAAKDFLPALHKYMHSMGWSNENKLTVREFPATGRGLCSKKQQFNASYDIISIPVKSFITHATLEADEHFKQLFNAAEFSKENRLTFHELLAFYLLYQKHLAQQSPFFAYLQTIPESFTNPYFCTLNELRCLPADLLEKIIEQKRAVRASYATLTKILATAECSCCGSKLLDEVFTLDLLNWAYFAVNSRTVHLNARYAKPIDNYFKKLLSNEPAMALAPFLDMANHSDRVVSTANVLTNNLNEYVFNIELLNCSKPLLPYEQIYISYGLCSNFKLLTDYGFILPCNKHEIFTIHLSDIENFIQNNKITNNYILHRNKFKFIREHNLHDAMLIVHEEGMSHNLHVVLHLLFREVSYFPNVLSEIAFGDAEHLADVQHELNLLLQFKIAEYERYLQHLQLLKNLSLPAVRAQEYLKECIQFLKLYIN